MYKSSTRRHDVDHVNRTARRTAAERRAASERRAAFAEAWGWRDVLGEQVAQCSKCANVVRLDHLVDLVGTGTGFVCRSCADQ
jgi:hypothetical protein